jgi:hypothetical protein
MVDDLAGWHLLVHLFSSTYGTRKEHGLPGVDSVSV